MTSERHELTEHHLKKIEGSYIISSRAYKKYILCRGCLQIFICITAERWINDVQRMQLRPILWQRRYYAIYMERYRTAHCLLYLVSIEPDQTSACDRTWKCPLCPVRNRVKDGPIFPRNARQTAFPAGPPVPLALLQSA